MTEASPAAKIREILSQVKDPEIPVIDIVELGIVRDIHIEGDKVTVDITPTYSGCPAMKVIEDEIITTLKQSGLNNVTINTVYSPAWTTDWLSEEAKEKLKNYGIAPPGAAPQGLVKLGSLRETIKCPFCGSAETALRSAFSSTACKALYYCNSCLQPFEQFKGI